MGVEDRDWYRETPEQRRSLVPWLLGAIMVVAALIVASPHGRRLLHLSPAPAVGPPEIHIVRRPLYPVPDPWKRFLADERTCPGGERTDLPPGRQEEVMLCLIDWARQRAGLSTPMQTALLMSTALEKAQEIVRCQNFAHAACGGEPEDDIRRTSYHGSWGENLYIADGRFGAPRVALDGWLNSPDHRDNLFRPEWTTQGIALVRIPRFGVYRDASLWVSHFGSE